jgi:hypothetical protein
MVTTATDSPTQPRTTRADTDVERDVARTKATVDQVVAMLSLQPPGSPCHNVTALYSGLYVPVHLFPNHRINVYAHPWSRGWSIFADEAPRFASASLQAPSNLARSLQLAPRIQAVHGPAAPAVLPARQDRPLARTTRADRGSYHRHHRPSRSTGPHPTSTLPQETLVLAHHT